MIDHVTDMQKDNITTMMQMEGKAHLKEGLKHLSICAVSLLINMIGVEIVDRSSLLNSNIIGVPLVMVMTAIAGGSFVSFVSAVTEISDAVGYYSRKN